MKFPSRTTLGVPMISVLRRKLRTFAAMPRHALLRKFKPARTRRANEYLDKNGVSSFLSARDAIEHPPQAIDLANLHQTVRRHKPSIILEFGSGFSTVVMAHALRMNGSGKIFSLEASEKWRDNTVAKIPSGLTDILYQR
jgi:hypothetical protein